MGEGDKKRDRSGDNRISPEKKRAWHQASTDKNNPKNAAALAVANALTKDAVPDPFFVAENSKISKCKEKFSEIIELVVCGKNYKEIAEELKLDYFSVLVLRQNDAYKPYFDKALALSAEMDQIKAEETLVTFIESENDNMAQAGVVRELSQFFRWRAQRRNQEDFGNKQQIKHEGEVKVSNKVSDQTEFDDLISKIKEKKRLQEERDRKEAEGEYIDYEEQKP